MIDLVEEETKFRDAMLKSIASKWSSEETREQHQQMLDWLDDQSEDDSFLVFSATLDYMATGEGRTMALIISRAVNYREFILHCMDKLGGYYYVIGIDVFRGLPLQNRVTDLLLSSAVRLDTENEMRRVNGCNYEVFLHHYVNCS